MLAEFSGNVPTVKRAPTQQLSKDQIDVNIKTLAYTKSIESFNVWLSNNEVDATEVANKAQIIANGLYHYYYEALNGIINNPPKQ